MLRGVGLGGWRMDRGMDSGGVIEHRIEQNRIGIEPSEVKCWAITRVIIDVVNL